MVIDKLRLISIADILTISNGICGILAIISFLVFYPDITIGTGLILLGVVFDGLDGAAARKFGSKHDFGRHLDSISDSFTFCLAPATLIFVIFFIPVNNAPFFSLETLTLPSNILVVIAGACVVYFGLKRLYEYTTQGYKLKEFLGLATPALAFFILVIAHILDPHKSINNAPIIPYFSLVMIIMGAILMSIKIKFPKIRGKMAAVLAIGIVLSLLSIELQKWFNLNSSDSIFIYYRIVSFLGLGLVICYVFISPVILNFYERRKGEVVTT